MSARSVAESSPQANAQWSWQRRVETQKHEHRKSDRRWIGVEEDCKAKGQMMMMIMRLVVTVAGLSSGTAVVVGVVADAVT